MLKTTAGNVLLNEHIPHDMRDYSGARVFDKKGVATFFDELARRHPDQYKDVAKGLSDVGRESAYRTAGFAFGLEHLRAVPEAEAVKRRIRLEVAQVQGRRDLDDKARDDATVAVLQKYKKPLEDAVFESAKASGNPLAHQVTSVGRGNKTALSGLLAGDLLYEDHHNNPIPFPVLESYSAGLSPASYFAASFGARKGTFDTKDGTAKGGFFNKQIGQVAHRLVVSREPDVDDDPERAYKPGEERGLPVTTDDPDNEGALLARSVGPYPRNTVLTPKVLAHIRGQGHDKILVRSPLVGGPPGGGVYARDAGVRERGGLPPGGDFIGLASAQAIGEKVTQGMLSSKHAGGVAGANRATSGFDFINDLIQMPKSFKGGATHAQADGKVRAVQEAPQGGYNVDVAGTPHYVPHGQKPSVAVGDQVEAGDVLSDGVPNHAEVTRHRGIGEGRRLFTTTFLHALRASGMPASRRNVELIARGLIDHVELDDEVGDDMPGDVLSYQHVESNYEPRQGARDMNPRDAVGHYLEKPALHHTVGTKVRASMLPELDHFGVKSLRVHEQPPPFHPVFVRAMSNLGSDPDWLVRHLGSGLQKSTLEAVHRGRVSDTAGTSFVPAAAERLNFGRFGATKGWDASEVEPVTQPVQVRDGDGDGRVADGTPKEAPAKRRGVLERLGL